jgi:hypothetical protein
VTTNRWTPTPRAGFSEREYTRCDGLRVRLEATPSGYRSEVELSGYRWTEDVYYAILTEHSRRLVDEIGRPPVLIPRFSKSAPDAELVHIDGTPHGWLAFLDANVPLQKISAIVVREFGRQSVEQIQSLRRDGWTILQIAAPYCTRTVDVPGVACGEPYGFDEMGRSRGEVWTRDILAERVEQVVPT